MICQKCNKDFPESEIQVSHDIPKYLGGTDKDGRHNLCKECHKKYESDILNLCLINFFSNQSEEHKKKFRFYAEIVRKAFFKDVK